MCLVGRVGSNQVAGNATCMAIQSKEPTAACIHLLGRLRLEMQLGRAHQLLALEQVLAAMVL